MPDGRLAAALTLLAAFGFRFPHLCLGKGQLITWLNAFSGQFIFYAVNNVRVIW